MEFQYKGKPTYTTCNYLLTVREEPRSNKKIDFKDKRFEFPLRALGPVYTGTLMVIGALVGIG